MISQVSRCCAASTAERSSSAAVSEKFPAATTPTFVLPGACVDLVEVVRGEAARADHDIRAVLERRHDVVLDRRCVREVDEDVGRRGRERFGDRRVMIGIGPRDAADELEVVGFLDRGGDRAPGPAGDAGDADAKSHRHPDLLASAHAPAAGHLETAVCDTPDARARLGAGRPAARGTDAAQPAPVARRVAPAALLT